jgi:hypothetical protein
MEFAVFVKSQVTTAGVRQSAMSHMYAGADLVPRPADCNRKKRERETLSTPGLIAGSIVTPLRLVMACF